MSVTIRWNGSRFSCSGSRVSVIFIEGFTLGEKRTAGGITGSHHSENRGMRLDLIPSDNTVANKITDCYIDREPRRWKKTVRPYSGGFQN
jgi:hypothetical protein